MKSVYFKVLFLFLAVAGSDKPLQAQGIYQFWGSTSTGGADDRGVLFSTKYDGSGFTLRHDFTTEHPGRAGLFQAPVAYNGKLYTLIEQYTVYFHSYCIITAYDIASGTYEQVADLALIDGRVAGGRLILHNNKLYGVTTKGGEHNEGLLFEYDPLTGTLLKKHDFAYATGSKPSSGLTAYNGQLYGTTPEGGDFDKGVLYQYDPSSGNFSIEKHFPDTYGYQNSGLTVYDGKLWGVNNNGIFAYVPGTDVLNTYAPVANIGLNSVYGHLTVLNGKLYGVANDGGSSGVGGIFEFNPATTALQLKYSFNEFSAQRRCELTVYAGKLYSSSYFSSDDTYGVLFSYDPILNVYENKIQFDATNSRGSGSLCLLGDLLYGFTWQGGAYNEGSLFAYEPATNLFEVKVNLGGNNLFHPVGRMISYNNKLYGLASTDVLTLQSGIFEYDPLLQTCVLKRSLSELEGITGSNQEGMIFYNNKFYGITTYGGTYGEGVLFSYNPATNTYAKIHDFDPATGSNPHAQLQLYAGRLYGTTNSGSTHDLGNIFEYNLLTGTYTQKVIFSETFGKRHYEGMTLVGNKFYGISLEGGTY